VPAAVDRRRDPVAAADEHTRILYQRLLSEPRNAQLRRALEDSPPATSLAGIRLVLVPGLFYRDLPHTGADGAFLKEVAHMLGLSFDTIPVDGSQGLDASADLINTWLAQCADDRRIVLFSLSMGSNEVRHALTRPGAAAFGRVISWVSISGLPFGSPAVDMTLANPLRRWVVKPWCRFKGWSYDNLRDTLRHRPGAPFTLPYHLTFVQVAAFPQRRHLNDRRSRRLHRWLASLGPNDGFALLEELAALPGLIYPVWGVDHYLNGATDMRDRLAALIRFCAAAPAS
jgi:hypothetical protein